MIDRLGTLVEELKERRATRFVVGYLVGAWIAAQVAGFFVEQGYVGRGFLDVTLFLLVVFFFVTVVLVWYHGERGHQKVQRLEGLLIVSLLLVAAGGSVWLATRDRGLEPDADAAIDLGESSVAVLPFQNQILSSEYGWLDRGIADLLATDLSQFDTLRVVSGQRLFDVMRQLGVEGARTVPEDMQTAVTRRAGARYMLTGSIIGTPDNLQIVATLSDIRTGDIRASSRARGSDVFAMVDEVSAAISSDLLGRRVSPVENAPVAQLTTNSLEAFREFDAGRDALWQYLNDDARAHFERAIELDSTFAVAHFQLAGLDFRAGDFQAANQHLQAAGRHLATASERDRLAVGAFLDFILGRRDEGERKFQELVAKYPDEKDARLIYTGFAPTSEAAEAQLETVLELDPYFAEAWNLLAYRYANRGDFEGADTLVDRYVALQPDLPNPHDSRGEIHELAGRYDEARASFRRALDIRADFAIALGHLARTYTREGRFDDMREAVEAYRSAEAPETRVWAWWLHADSWMWEGDVERALAGYDSLVAVAASARPDLYGRALEGLMRTRLLLGDYSEAAALSDSLVRVRGADGRTVAVALHYLGSVGRIEEMERIRNASLEVLRDAGTPETFAFGAQAGMDLLIEHYRGDHADVLGINAEILERSGFPISQLGYPVILSALELGDAPTARAAVNRMMTNAVAPEFHAPPLETRLREYFRARIAELEGDADAATAGYDRLLDGWAGGVARVPLLRDVQSRRDALASGSGP